MKVVILFTLVGVTFLAYSHAQCENQPRNPQCRGAMDVGQGGRDCRARVWFFFDESSRSCRPMNYRGCGGNQNRFCSRADCERLCERAAENCPNQPREPECRGPRDLGRGGADCRSGARFFFDTAAVLCREMPYLGCDGNRNRFCSRLDCERLCERRTDCPNQPREPDCRGPRDLGRGGADCRSGTRFYFDAAGGFCREMHFMGCGGNNNRFCSHRDCERRCGWGF